MKQTILFVQDPEYRSTYLPKIQKQFNCVHYKLTTKLEFINFLTQWQQDNKEQIDTQQISPIRAIYGGFPAFHPIGGLTEDIIELPIFQTIKCIAICSRGINNIDLDALKKHGIQLYNYQDSIKEIWDHVDEFQLDLVSNDVADCAMWHVLEGFRKFSLNLIKLQETNDTIQARLEVGEINMKRFAFGHELTNGKFIQSPRNKNCLILGMGSIGKQIGLKLQYGLGMKISYSCRSEKEDISKEMGWNFYPLADIVTDLNKFECIVIALPGTPETYHLINANFLAHCQDGIVIVNIGRGMILDMNAIGKAISSQKIRHLGVDVFTNEPNIDEIFQHDYYNTTSTPHIGSGTMECFQQSCDLALTNIMKTLTLDKNDSFSRVF